MNIASKIYIGVQALGVLAVSCTYYWSARYFLEADNAARSELLVGEAMMILFTSPLWLGATVISLALYKQLSKVKLVFSFTPAVLVFMPMALREFSNAL